jgi:ABC-type cobalamin/Fe3+-siderophores transport system ATPase subunit
MGVINANNITVELSNKIIFKRYKFRIPVGKVTAIIGPNGCG